MLFNIIMPSCHTILVGCRHFDVGSDLSAIASVRELHLGVKPYTICYPRLSPAEPFLTPDQLSPPVDRPKHPSHSCIVVGVGKRWSSRLIGVPWLPRRTLLEPLYHVVDEASGLVPTSYSCTTGAGIEA